MRPRSVLVPLAAAVVVAVVALVLASGNGGSGGGSSHAASALTSGQIVIKSFNYLPPNATVRVGTKLIFADRDSAEHTATSDDRMSFNTGPIQIGQQKSITLTKAGTFAYHCDFHPFMHGSLTVR